MNRSTPASTAQTVRVYGPFPGISRVNGLTYDGRNVWIATDDALNAIDPANGELGHAIDIPAHAGTAFDGRHLYQLDEALIRKVDPETGDVLATIPAPSDGSGLAWAEGVLWMGAYSSRRIYQLDPGSGEILRTIASDRFVTGVTWIDDELWHAVWEDGESELRRIDSGTGEVLERLEMPAEPGVSGIDSDGAGNIFCGQGGAGTVAVVRRPAG